MDTIIWILFIGILASPLLTFYVFGWRSKANLGFMFCAGLILSIMGFFSVADPNPSSYSQWVTVLIIAIGVAMLLTYRRHRSRKPPEKIF